MERPFDPVEPGGPKMVLFCTLCPYCCNVRLDLIKHLFSSHSVEATFHFVCGIKGCLHSFKFGSTYSSFKTHANRKHPNWQDYVNEPDAAPLLLPTSSSMNLLNPESDLSESDLPAVNEHLPELPEPVVLDTELTSCPSAQRTAALFLLTFQERYKLSQKAINFAVGTINALVDGACESLRDSLQDRGSLTTDVAACFDEREDSFAHLQTEYMQTKFYRDEFGLVEPVTVELGTTYQYKRSGAKRLLIEKPDTFQYVPLIDNLQWLLQNKDVYQEVYKERVSNSSEYMYDFCDGEVFNEHPLFSTDSDALQIVMYYDDVETANPLGSYRGKHKLGLFYYLLGNIEPKLRSSLKSIQLVACVSTENLEKYGFDTILKPFIQEANTLSKGVVMTIQGVKRVVKGAVLFALADTLASHSMGGFKIGVGFSLRKCRMCLATRDQLSTKFKARDFTPRTPETYNYHCALLDGPLSYEDSITYGVNALSPLNDIDNFHVVNQLPQDIMHILLEGVIPYELVRMLTYFVVNRKYFTIDQLNDRIACFAYSNQEAKDKPSPIKAQVVSSIGARLSQSSAQMWSLAINLPLMIGDKVCLGDQLWECFLLLLDILQLCTTRVATSAQAGILEALIHDHHHLFTRCYPAVNITPKMHYMVHFPRQIIRTGPLIATWCMRMEGKNSYFKRIAQSSNFKNVSYTVAKRHQRLLCAYLHGGTFFDKEVECGPAKEPKPLLTEDQDIVTKVKELESIAGNPFVALNLVYRPKWIIYMGIKYTFSEFVVIGWQCDDLPVFGQIQHIVVVNDFVLFGVTLYCTLGIDRHYHSYIITRKNEAAIYSLTELVDYQPLRAHYLTNGHLYITLRSHIEKVSS